MCKSEVLNAVLEEALEGQEGLPMEGDFPLESCISLASERGHSREKQHIQMPGGVCLVLPSWVQTRE